MRVNRRTAILDAALGVIDDGGVTAVTFESVAERAGITKGGLLYHFPTRELLLQALHEHLAHQWEASLLTAVGMDADAAGQAGRLAAYARVATQSATRAELLLMLETVNEPAMPDAWTRVVSQWTPVVPSRRELAPDELRMLVARLAAEGLWLHASLDATPLDPAVRAQVADYLVGLTGTADAEDAP